MKKSTIIVTNLVVNVLMTLLFIKLNSNGRHGYENAITFVFWSGSVLGIQLLANLGFSIYFFAKKDNEKAKTFLLAMLLLCFLAFISGWLALTAGFN